MIMQEFRFWENYTTWKWMHPGGASPSAPLTVEDRRRRTIIIDFCFLIFAICFPRTEGPLLSLKPPRPRIRPASSGGIHTGGPPHP
jgi:hypothetical protein